MKKLRGVSCYAFGVIDKNVGPHLLKTSTRMSVVKRKWGQIRLIILSGCQKLGVKTMTHWKYPIQICGTPKKTQAGWHYRSLFVPGSFLVASCHLLRFCSVKTEDFLDDELGNRCSSKGGLTIVIERGSPKAHLSC